MNGNKFKGLSPEMPLNSPPPKKTKRTTNFVEFPQLPPRTNFRNPKFVIISSSDENKPLSNVSIFVLKKSIDAISKEYESVSQLRDGSILILAKNKTIAEKFMAISNIANICPVKVKYHDRLNSSKGIVFAPYLINVPESDIISEMAIQGITEVYKFTKNIEGKHRPTGLMLFTFDLYQPPATVEIGFYKEKVKEYIPNPMRCRRCQILGHTIKRCTKEEICATCSLQPHENAPASCTRVMCANCPPTAEPHPSSSINCPKYIKNKEILTIKTRNKCTISEARHIYNINKPTETSVNNTPYNVKAKTGNNLSSSTHNPVSLPTAKTTPHSSVSLSQNSLNPQTSSSSSSNALQQSSNNTKIYTTLTTTDQQKIIETTKQISQINTNNPKNNKIQEEMIVSDSDSEQSNNLSPISNITQSLLLNNKYYLTQNHKHDDDEQPPQ